MPSSPEETSQKKSRGRPRKGAGSHAQISSVIDPRPDVPTNQQNTHCQSQPSTLCDAVDQRITALNRGASLFFNTIRDVVDRAQLQTNLPPSPANPGPSTRNVVRCVLATDDNIRINQLTPKDIADAFEAEGGLWNHVAATRREDRSLRLFLDSPEDKHNIEMHATEIPRILGLPGRCKPLGDAYLVKAKRFQLRKTTLPEPNERISAWSKRNKTHIIKASWRNGKLILAMASMEDALTLCERRQVYLDGQVGEVVPFDQRALPVFCYNCYGPNHKRDECNNGPECGQCASTKHHSKDCDGKLQLKCRNCGHSHRAWDPRCKHPAVLDMRAECTKWEESGPPWSPQYERRPKRKETRLEEPGVRSPAAEEKPIHSGTSLDTDRSQSKNPRESIILPMKRKDAPSAEPVDSRKALRTYLQQGKLSFAAKHIPVVNKLVQTTSNSATSVSSDELPTQDTSAPPSNKLFVVPDSQVVASNHPNPSSTDQALASSQHLSAGPPSSDFNFTAPLPLECKFSSIKLAEFPDSPNQP